MSYHYCKCTHNISYYLLLFFIKRKKKYVVSVWSYLIKKGGIWDTMAAEVFLSDAFNCQSFSIGEKIVDIAWVDAYSSTMQFIFSFFSFSIVLIDHFNCPSACLKNTNTFSFYFFERTRKLKDRYCLRWLFFPIMTVHQCIRRKNVFLIYLLN
jgi:hypothetical protein